MGDIKIEQQYVVEARRIILEYDKVIAAMNSTEDALKLTKSAILKYQSELEALKNKPIPDKIKELELNEISTGFEKDIDTMQDSIKPHLVHIEELRKSSHTLYGILKEKYPGASETQLKDALNIELAKLNV